MLPIDPVHALDLDASLQQVVAFVDRLEGRLREVRDELDLRPVLEIWITLQSDVTPAIVLPPEITRWAADMRVALEVELSVHVIHRPSSPRAA
jgi:hypothetical protein